MKNFAPILTACFILVLVIGSLRAVNGWTDAHKAAWQVEADAKAALRVNDYADELHNEQQRRAVVTQVAGTMIVLILLLAAGSGAVLLWQVYDKRQESRARMVDGSFALQTYKNDRGQQWTVDANKSMFGAIGFDKASGQLVTDAQIVGADRQLSYVRDAVQKTRTAQARDVSQIRNSAQAKLEAGYYDRTPPRQVELWDVAPEPEPAQLTAAAWQPLTLADAFAQSTTDQWLLGQNATGACSLSMLDAQHVGILGAQGTGKTNSTGILMMLLALKSHFHVVALDGKGGVDWMRYQSHIEVYPTDYSLIGDQVNELYRIYAMRLKALGMAGASDIYELDYEMKPIMVILEEFGATMDLLKAESSKQHTTVEGMIKQIFRKGRSTGVHLVLIDQLMNGWPGVMKANTKGIVAYKIGGQQGAAFNAYKLHELADKGQFWNNGSVYDAWFTKPEAESLLQRLQPSRTKLLTNVEYSVTHADTLPHNQGGSVSTENTPLSDVSGSVSGTFYQSKTVSNGVSVDTSVSPTTDTPNPPLVGKPVSKKDIELVRNTYAITNNSARETARLLWGKRNDSRVAWVKEIVTGQVMQ